MQHLLIRRDHMGLYNWVIKHVFCKFDIEKSKLTELIDCIDTDANGRISLSEVVIMAKQYTDELVKAAKKYRKQIKKGS